MSGGRDDGPVTDYASRLTPSEPQRSKGYSVRLFGAQVLGLVGIVLYNWWVWVVVATNLLVNSDEFFSDLEATSRHDATLFQHFDLAAGLVMLVAFLLRGPWGPEAKRKEWRWLLLFAVAGTVGGHYGYACPEGLSAACRNAEWHLRLPLHHYVHVVSGIIEFAAMTTAVYIAWKRTREDCGWVAQGVRATALTMLIGYPLLAVAYLTDRVGAFVEPLFFVCFSVMVAIEVLEPGRHRVVSVSTSVSGSP
jgi:hypothetical protein